MRFNRAAPIKPQFRDMDHAELRDIKFLLRDTAGDIDSVLRHANGVRDIVFYGTRDREQVRDIFNFLIVMTIEWVCGLNPANEVGLVSLLALLRCILRNA